MSKKLPTVWTATEHTKAKIAILKGYLDAWFRILGKTRKNQPILYVDGFAGPGGSITGLDAANLRAGKVPLARFTRAVVLRTAAVLGREFTLEQLAALTDDLGEERLLSVLEEALAARLIEELPRSVGRFGFTHALAKPWTNECRNFRFPISTDNDDGRRTLYRLGNDA